MPGLDWASGSAYDFVRLLRSGSYHINGPVMSYTCIPFVWVNFLCGEGGRVFIISCL